MNQGRAMLLLCVLAAAGGGCDMGGGGRFVSREEYDKVQGELARQKAEAANLKAQLQQLRADVERERKDVAKTFSTVREQEDGKAQRVPELERTNVELVAQVKRAQGRVLDLQGQLTQAQKSNESLRRENELIRSVLAQSGRLGPARPAGVDAAAVPAATAATAPAPVPAAAGDGDERARLLEMARRELEGAKVILQRLEAPPAVAPAPAPAPAPGRVTGKTLRGVVLLARGRSVIIDLGTQDGVKKDMPARIYRDGAEVAPLRLTAIGDSTAEGLVADGVVVKDNDKVVVGGEAGGGE